MGVGFILMVLFEVLLPRYNITLYIYNYLLFILLLFRGYVESIVI